MSAWTRIDHRELSSNQTSIEFNSISGSYTDLCLKMSLRSGNSGDRNGMFLTFNGNTGTNYSQRRLIGYDSSQVLSDGVTNQTPSLNDYIVVTGNTATSNTFGSIEIYLPNYTSTVNKSYSADFTAENNSSSSYILGILAGLFSSSSAITSIKIEMTNAAVITQNSSATLYGITKGSSGGVTVS